MASDRHLAKLKDGAESWNDWRRAEPAVRPDLQGLSLSLGDKQWGETNGGPIDLSRALLRDANLRHATLTHGNLAEANLISADLTGARLRRADLRKADLSHARLDDADLEDALLDGADLSGADLRSARNLKPAQLEAARGDPKTLLPSRFVTPRAWMNGPRRPDFAAAPAGTTPKTKWTGTFSKAPPPAPAAQAMAVAKTSWVSGFGQPAAPAAVPSGSALQKGSFISAFAKHDLPAAPAPAAPAPASRASWAATLAKSAAPAIAAASAAAAAKASRTAGFIKSSASNGLGSVLSRRSEARAEAAASAETGLAPARANVAMTAEPAGTVSTEVSSARAATNVSEAADASAAADAAAKPGTALAIVTELKVRRSRFSDALEGKPDPSSEPDLTEDPDATVEGPDPRWIADLARRAGATPIEEAAYRVKEWCGALVRGVAKLNPARAMRAMRDRLSGFRPLGGLARRLKGTPEADTSDVRAAGEGMRSSLGLLYKTSFQVAIATVIALLLIGGAARLMYARQVGAETLKENVPLSADAAASEDEPQRVALLGPAQGPQPVEDVKGQSVVPLAKPSAQVAPLKSELPLGTIKPVGVTDAKATAIKPENLPIPRRITEKGTQVALAASADRAPGEAPKATDARDATTVAQSTVRPHGELATPDGNSDPATPLVTSPQPAKRPVVSPVKTQAPPSAPLKKQADPPADDAANKLSFAGEGLNALQKVKKPPATVVEYLKEPDKSTPWVEAFIKKFYLSSAELSDGEIRQIYSEPMDFFGEKNVDLDRVAQEKSSYYKEWPKRHYKLVPGSIEVQWTNENVAEVSFLYDFNVSAPDKTPNRGRGRAVLTLDLSESPGRITREDGEVVSTN